jgi:hypothetical protein
LPWLGKMVRGGAVGGGAGGRELPKRQLAVAVQERGRGLACWEGAELWRMTGGEGMVKKTDTPHCISGWGVDVT